MSELIKNLPEGIKILIILIPVISVFVASLTLLLSLKQSRLNNKLAKSKIISDTLHSFMDNEEIQKAFYELEYDEFKYSQRFHGSDQEKRIDMLLRHYSNLALMWKNGLLTIKDIYPIQYYLIRIVQNSEVQKYFKFMAEFTNRNEISNHPFLALDELGKTLKQNSTL